VIGSLPGIKKFFLGFAGIHGDRKAGIQRLQIAADRGHYLRPFAKILLALAALHEKQMEVARAQLTEPASEFPKNPLFLNELAKRSRPRIPSESAEDRHRSRPLASRLCPLQRGSTEG